MSPVGLLCRDCVKQTSAGGLSASKRIARGARVRARKFVALDSPVTIAIIAINLIVFALQLLSHYFGRDEVTAALWYLPAYSLAEGTHQVPGGVLPQYPSGFMYGASFEPWRLVTVMFTHSVSFLPHILFNMFALYIFGRHLETAIGKFRFLALYLLAGLGGSAFVMLWGYADPLQVFRPTVGASGAIFGILAATVVAFRAMNTSATSLIVLIAINFAIGFIPGTNVSWQAHLGGMVIGSLAMWIIVRTRGPRLKKRQIIELSALTLAVVLLTCAFLVVSPF